MAYFTDNFLSGRTDQFQREWICIDDFVGLGIDNDHSGQNGIQYDVQDVCRCDGGLGVCGVS